MWRSKKWRSWAPLAVKLFTLYYCLFASSCLNWYTYLARCLGEISWINFHLGFCPLAPDMHAFFETLLFELHPGYILVFVVSAHSLHSSSALRYLTSTAWKSLPFTLWAFSNLWIVLQKQVSAICAFDCLNLFVSINMSSQVKFKGRFSLFRAAYDYLWSIEELMFLPCSWMSSAPHIFMLGGTTLISKGNCAST